MLGDVTVDIPAREVWVKGAQLSLRTKEFDLFLALVQHRGMVLTRDQLIDRVWGNDFYGETRTVDVHVSHLREKLAASAVTIETIRSVGYKLVVSPAGA